MLGLGRYPTLCFFKNEINFILLAILTLLLKLSAVFIIEYVSQNFLDSI